VTPRVLSHLRVLGRWCPGIPGVGPHPADGLTERAGRVLCGSCADLYLAEHGEPAA
jgi:hypothetical protein